MARKGLGDAGGYQPPPTGRDAAPSVEHHRDSLSYNLGHARAHADEALMHARALKDRLGRHPKFRPHVRALDRSLKR